MRIWQVNSCSPGLSGTNELSYGRSTGRSPLILKSSNSTFSAHGLESLPFVFAVLGIIGAWLLYVRYPSFPEVISQRARFLYTLLVRKYFFDEVNEVVFAAGARRVGDWFWKIGDLRLIDGLAVNGTARVVGWFASVVRYVQSGYVYHYAFAMILGLFLLITFFLHR